MYTTEEWLKEKVFEYNNNPKESLENMLASTIEVMEQYKNNIDSKAAKSVFDSCIVHNKLFLNKIGVIGDFQDLETMRKELAENMTSVINIMLKSKTK